MNYNEAEITSVSDYSTLIDIKLKDSKISDKQKKNIKDLLLESFRIGAEVANNKKSRIKL